MFCPEATAEAQGFAKLGLDVGPLTSPRRLLGADLDTCPWTESGLAGTPHRLDVQGAAGGDVAQRGVG